MAAVAATVPAANDNPFRRVESSNATRKQLLCYFRVLINRLIVFRSRLTGPDPNCYTELSQSMARYQWQDGKPISPILSTIPQYLFWRIDCIASHVPPFSRSSQSRKLQLCLSWPQRQASTLPCIYAMYLPAEVDLRLKLKLPSLRL